MKEIQFHFKSIAMRWFFKVYLIIAFAVISVAVILALLFVNLIFSSVQSQATDYAQTFDNLSTSNTENFYDNAILLSDDFEYKNKIEVQVLDKSGQIIISTTGFKPSDVVKDEYDLAKGEVEGFWVERLENSGGENIMAGTQVIYDSKGEAIGAYRWVTSLKASYGKINITIVLIIVISLAVLGLCALSGLFFIRAMIARLRKWAISPVKLQAAISR